MQTNICIQIRGVSDRLNSDIFVWMDCGIKASTRNTN